MAHSRKKVTYCGQIRANHTKSVGDEPVDMHAPAGTIVTDAYGKQAR